MSESQTVRGGFCYLFKGEGNQAYMIESGVAMVAI